ncbi:MAG: hypothetical protein ACOC3C_08235 [Candidatus Thorarchaeota archaeon]
MSENEDQLEIIIERDSTGKRIILSGIAPDDEFSNFDDAYGMLLELWQRAEKIETKAKLGPRIDNAKRAMERFWIEKDDKLVLDENIGNISHRIGLCLLKHYPECLSQRPIADEISRSKTSVGDRVRGDSEEVHEYFYRCETGYQLTNAGLYWVLDKVIPAVVNLEDAELNTN